MSMYRFSQSSLKVKTIRITTSAFLESEGRSIYASTNPNIFKGSTATEFDGRERNDKKFYSSLQMRHNQNYVELNVSPFHFFRQSTPREATLITLAHMCHRSAKCKQTPQAHLDARPRQAECLQRVRQDVYTIRKELYLQAHWCIHKYTPPATRKRLVKQRQIALPHGGQAYPTKYRVRSNDK